MDILITIANLKAVFADATLPYRPSLDASIFPTINASNCAVSDGPRIFASRLQFPVFISQNLSVNLQCQSDFHNPLDIRQLDYIPDSPKKSATSLVPRLR
ncbi:unnamed protein product [Schistocephalus solidus]|uniref:Uncharacterized protein n=1 Tax=Schistocephalus solidus TaxID=70667 RepID=A0A183TI80_SCHSO|nr:unnamed protein product [Schistocephalus solidus]